MGAVQGSMKESLGIDFRSILARTETNKQIINEGGKASRIRELA